jgi:hypothetical protein
LGVAGSFTHLCHNTVAFHGRDLHLNCAARQAELLRYEEMSGDRQQELRAACILLEKQAAAGLSVLAEPCCSSDGLVS